MESNGNAPALIGQSDEGRRFLERLNEPATLQTLEKLLQRLDTIEKAVEDLGVLMSRLPGMVAMTTDMVDETFREASARGVDLDERMKILLGLLERVSDPATVEKLEGALRLADQAPGMAAMTVDMVDETFREASARGVDLDERMKILLGLLERVSDPATVEKLEAALQFADRAPGIAAMTVDMVDEAMGDLARKGLDLNQIGQALSALGLALSNAQAQPSTRMSLWKTIGALKDPDRQKAMGFLMTLLKELGRQL
ncbi:MAG: DUF1641 domain-containing protein [Bacteroidetes bacterium]|nr:MAG: DUF1641 domain-containing protein [Bacteroidota bacterium]